MTVLGLPNYQVTVIAPTTGEVIRIFDSQTFTSLQYSLALNDVGAMVMTFDTDEDMTDLFPLDAMIDIQRTDPTTNNLVLEETYFARLTHRLQENNQQQFIVGGLSLNHLIARRVVDPADDPLQAGGYSTKAGAADTVMRAYANEQMVASAAARRFVDFSIDPTSGVGESVGKRLRYENLLDVFQSICANNDMDFHIERRSGREMALTIARIGTDKTYARNYPFSGFVLLDPARGNLANPSLLTDRKKEGTFGYFLGQGPGEQRITLPIGTDDQYDSPWNRIEFSKDVRQAERGDSLQILTEARAQLKDAGVKVEFTFDMTGQLPGNAYRIDWIVGDRITAQWESVMVDLRITGVEFNIDQSGETMNIATELL